MYSRTAPNRLPYMRERGPMRPVETFSNALRHYKSLRVERAASVSRKEDVQTERKSTHQGAVGPSTDLTVIADRLSELALPYWREGPQVKQARMKLAGVIALTLGTTGVSVLFSYLGRDFFNALSAKDQAKFTEMLFKWLGALCLGIPVFVLRDYYQSKLALDWREWMTEKLTAEYFEKRKFYKIQSSALLDNPDQRIAVDVGCVFFSHESMSLMLIPQFRRTKEILSSAMPIMVNFYRISFIMRKTMICPSEFHYLTFYADHLQTQHCRLS